MNDTDRPDKERVAFCQNCGRPLSSDGVRNVGSAVYCEPCLIAKVAAAETSGAASGAPGGGAGSHGFGGSSSGGNYQYGGSIPPAPPTPPGAPNPGLAALLGFIPGVGAFYNGQYAKGIVHLVVFAILTTLSDRNGIFGLFVAGWIFYQVIEAHHTARARRDGTPLPNPFGLNDIGERLGFGRAWPGTAHTQGQPPVSDPPSAATGSSWTGPGWTGQGQTGQGPTGQGQTGPGQTASGGTGPGGPGMGSGYGPPASGYAPQQAGYANYAPPPPAGGWGAPTETYGYVPPAAPFSPAGSGSRVPTGAILLIGLGILFLIGNSGLFHGFPVERLIPFFLIGVGVWFFVRKMMETGGSLADDGTPAYRLRLFRAARGPVWIVLVGVLFLLDSFDILSWGRSWPLFIIVGGLMTFFERTAYSAAQPPLYGYTPPVAPAAPEPDAAASTAIVPSGSEDGKGN